MNKRPDKSIQLRQRAEATLRPQITFLPECLEALSPDEMRQMLHELHVYQIELEMQNEELCESQIALDAERARYFDFYDLAPVGYCTLSEKGLILEANLTTATLLGVHRGALIMQPFSRFFLKNYADLFYRHRKMLVETGEPQSCELQMIKPDGTPFWASLTTTLSSPVAATTAQKTHGLPVLRIVLSEISERKQIEAALQESEQRFRSLMENIPGVAVQGYTLNGTVTFWNPASERLYGYSASEALGTNLLDLNIPAEMKEGVAEAIQQMVKTGEPIPASESFLKRKDGSRVPVFSSHALVNPIGRSPELFCLDIDLTERKEAEEALREQKEFFHLIAENIGDFIAVVDPEGRRLYNSPSYKKFFGDPRDLLGTDSFAQIHPEDRERVKQVFRETVHTGQGYPLEYRLVMTDGSVREMESRGSVIKNAEGRVARVVVVAQDITERKQMEYQLRQLAFQDALTKLPNRRLLNDRLGQTIAASLRSGLYGAVMFLDLDNFKRLNDKHGHDAGDLLLIEVAERLTSCVREMDTVARFGGDEFVLMISELAVDEAKSFAEAGFIAEKIRLALADRYQLTIRREGKPDKTIRHHCTASIGVTLFINHQTSEDDILKQADTAMYQAKAAGRNQIRFYDPDAERPL